MRYQFVLLLLLSVTACGKVEKLNVDADVTDADPCTGTCECRIDDDCAAAHTGCDDQVTSRTCECVAGYSKNLSGACEFSGVVQDPGFQSAAAWMIGNAAIDVNLNEVGMVEPGAVRFTGLGLCTLSRIQQRIQMPKLSRAEPLVAQVTYRYRDPMFFGGVFPAFGIGAGWQDDLPINFNNFATRRECLGTAQYAPESTTGLGAELALAMMPSQLPFGPCDDPNITLDIDRFDIVPANPDECPGPGVAINGDLESTGGWTFQGSSANGNPFSTAIEPNVGEANTRGIRLFTRNRCSNVFAFNQISVPDASVVPSPALSFFNKTTASLPGVETTSNLGGVVLPAITATGAASTQKVCVPAFMRGGVFLFRGGMGIDGTCAELVNAESLIDNLRILNDPSCGTDLAVTDPGFESPLALIGASSTPGKSLARTVNNPATAHSGNGALQLSVMQLCSGASWQANVVVPAPGAGAGPALKFFYRATPPANYTFGVNAGPGAGFAPILDDQYREGTICLDPKLVARNQRVTFSMGGGGGTCAVTHPPETAFVDDLAVTTDPACPTM